jgi:hypothetical protein
MKLWFDHTVPGWASAVSVVSSLFGILFILLGLIGEYLGRILIEVRRRPRYLVEDRIGIGRAARDRVGVNPFVRTSGRPSPPAAGTEVQDRSADGSSFQA